MRVVVRQGFYCTYKCFTYDTWNVCTTDTGDFKDLINICLLSLHFLSRDITACKNNQQDTDGRLQSLADPVSALCKEVSTPVSS